MNIFSLLVLIVGMVGGFFLGSFYYYLFPLYHVPSYARAVIYPTKGNQISGVVHFEQQKDGVRISAKLQGLPAGEHGFHIHEYGDCSCDDAVCAGGHFNPTNAPHGAPADSNVHIGDLGNIRADESGNAEYDAINPRIKFFGPHSIIGRAMIIHEKRDDLKSQPTGDAGSRIGCGVIGISKE